MGLTDYQAFLQANGVPCTACGQLDVEPYELQAAVVLCGHCASWVTNHYSHRRSGRWLTWPNPPAPKPAYQKRKIPRTLRTQVFERDAYRCRRCGDHRDLRADHVIPESRGGPTTFENLQTLCARCNSRKGTRTT
jgi:5-methylcytosine-specific restriction endonuclease McrA